MVAALRYYYDHYTWVANASEHSCRTYERIKQIDIPYGAYMCVWIVRIHTAGMLMQQYMCEYFILITFSNGNNGTKISRNTSTPFHNLSHTHIHTCTHAYLSTYTCGLSTCEQIDTYFVAFLFKFCCVHFVHAHTDTHTLPSPKCAFNSTRVFIWCVRWFYASFWYCGYEYNNIIFCVRFEIRIESSCE